MWLSLICCPFQKIDLHRHGLNQSSKLSSQIRQQGPIWIWRPDFDFELIYDETNPQPPTRSNHYQLPQRSPQEKHPAHHGG